MQVQHDLVNAKVLVVGDVMLDRYWSGPVQRISPEAPVPIVHVGDIEERAGGAGNVALNVTALSGNSAICTLVGKDEGASKLVEIMRGNAVKTYFVETDLPTITKLRVLSQHQQLLRMDFEVGFEGVDKAPLLDQFSLCLEDYNAVIISDYGKGVLTDVQLLIQKARAKGIPVLVDPKGADFSKYHGASVITPNMKEFELVVGRCASEEALVQKAQNLINEVALEAILITRSEKGMTLVDRHGGVFNIPTLAKEVFDVTGAGDTVIAVLGMALSVGYSYEEAMSLANAAAGVVVGKIGTATLTLAELHRALNKTTKIPSGVIDQAELLEAMQLSHLQGEKVVMTNGCFDILHAGHVTYLKAARKLGDRLIVAVNDDPSVARLKGASRPIVSLENRMSLLAALECVDWVVAFSEDTPHRIISEVLPDILVKGADYEVHQIAGSKEVLENGGEVKTITLVPGCSTSAIISKILEEGIS